MRRDGYTFFKSRGLPVGRSPVVRPTTLAAAREIEAEATQRGMQTNAGRSRRVRSGGGRQANEVLEVGDPRIDDRSGSTSAGDHQGVREHSSVGKTVVWNGQWACSRSRCLQPYTAIAERGRSLNGNDDRRRRRFHRGGQEVGIWTDKITHISTGGGASLEFLGGQSSWGRCAHGRNDPLTVNSPHTVTVKSDRLLTITCERPAN